MSIKIEIDEKKLRGLVLDYLRAKLGDVSLNSDRVVILVKSKQNYKSEWEEAAFKATYESSDL